MLDFFCYDIIKQRPNSGTFLFNDSRHLFLQAEKGWRMYGLMHSLTKQVAAKISIHVGQEKACSPFRAPFGSLELYGSITFKEGVKLFQMIEEDLKALDVNLFLIRNYPERYHPQATKLLHQVAAFLNYTCIEETSSIITIDKGSFAKKITTSQRQKLKKSEKQFFFSERKSDALIDVYGFINACRKERNQSLSMTLSQVQDTQNMLPANFLFFQVGNEEGIAAAAIVIKVSEKILYTFYYAHDKKFDKISPVVFLMSGIYKYAQENQVTHIDLGTSMVNGAINTPLLRFKKSIGGKSNSKYIFEKILQ